MAKPLIARPRPAPARTPTTTSRRHRARPDPTAGPSLERGTPLPGGRAVVGALLVTVAAVGVFAAFHAASEGPTDPVIVAAVDLPAGHRLEAADLRVEPADLPASSAAQSFSSAAPLEGGITLAPLHAGDLVQQSAVRQRGAGDEPANRSFSFAVERERALDGELQRGERVDVLATYGSNETAYTSVVARDVELIDVDTGATNGGLSTGGKLTVTVSLLDGDDVLRLAHATVVAPITLVRATTAEGSRPGTLDTYQTPGGRADRPGSTAAAPSSTAATSTTRTGSPTTAREGG